MIYEIHYSVESSAIRNELHNWVMQLDTPELTIECWQFSINHTSSVTGLSVSTGPWKRNVIVASGTHETMLLLKYSHIIRVSPLPGFSFELIKKDKVLVM